MELTKYRCTLNTSITLLLNLLYFVANKYDLWYPIYKSFEKSCISRTKNQINTLPYSHTYPSTSMLFPI